MRPILLLVALLAGAPAHAAVPPEASAAWARLAEIQALRARFVQVQHRKMLSKPMESRGMLVFERPGRLLWRTESPADSTFVLDGDRVGIAWPTLRVREEVDLSAQPELARLVEGLTIWLAADLSTLQADYDVTWEAGPPMRATLKPHRPEIQKLLASIEVTLSQDPAHVYAEQVRLVEPDGDTVDIRLEGVEFDPALPQGTFVLPDVE